MTALGASPESAPATPAPDRWWVVASGSGVGVFLLAGMIYLWPTAPLTWMVGAAVAAFALVMWLNPRHWLKRRSSACMGIAGACAALPAVAGALQFPQGVIEFSTAASPWVAALFGLLSLGFAWLDRNGATRPVLGGAPGSRATASHSGIAVNTRDHSPVSIDNTCQSGTTPIHTGDHTTITLHQAPDRPTPSADVQAVVEKAMEEARKRGTLEAQNQSLSAENDRLKSDLAAALQRVETRAEATADPQALAAIAQARSSGDLTTLDAAIDAEFARREHQIKNQAADWFELCRESAAVAFIRGDIDKAQSRLEMILKFFPNDLDAINRLGQIHHLRGELDKAQAAYRRVEALAPDDSWMAVALGNLGNVLWTRSDLDGAEAMYRKALVIHEKLGRLEGMANNYGSLGIILQSRGDLDGAAKMLRIALEIDEKLGRLEGMAINYGNLGVVLRTRNDLDGAEAMHRKSLAIEEKLGRLEGIAADYGNLGIIFHARNDLDRAEEMYRRSLEISDAKGMLELSASQYGNLSSLLRTRGDLDGAEAMHLKGVAIEEKLGRLEGLAKSYGNFGNLLETRGDLDGAEEMHRKALSLNEKLARLEGMAINCGNLGTIARKRGVIEGEAGARALWTRSRDCFARLGAKPMVEKVQGWLDELPKP